MGDLSDFQRGNTDGAHLAVASVNKTANLLRLSRTAVSKVMVAHTNQGNTLSAKRNTGRKPKLIKRDRLILKGTISKNYRTTAAKVTAELNILVEDPGYTKPV